MPSVNYRLEQDEIDVGKKCLEQIGNEKAQCVQKPEVDKSWIVITGVLAAFIGYVAGVKTR